MLPIDDTLVLPAVNAPHGGRITAAAVDVYPPCLMSMDLSAGVTAAVVEIARCEGARRFPTDLGERARLAGVGDSAGFGALTRDAMASHDDR